MCSTYRMSKPSRKRPFERRDGLLQDQYRGVDGRKFIASMPGSVVGEPVPDAERVSRRAEIGGNDGLKAGRAMYALGDEHSPELLEQLLMTLEARDGEEVVEYLREKYGPDAVFTVWNEEDANRPR
jgi:hypothetical protein